MTMIVRMEKEKLGKGHTVRLPEDLEKKILAEAETSDRGVGYVIRKRLEISFKAKKRL